MKKVKSFSIFSYPTYNNLPTCESHLTIVPVLCFGL